MLYMYNEKWKLLEASKLDLSECCTKALHNIPNHKYIETSKL